MFGARDCVLWSGVTESFSSELEAIDVFDCYFPRRGLSSNLCVFYMNELDFVLSSTGFRFDFVEPEPEVLGLLVGLISVCTKSSDSSVRPSKLRFGLSSGASEGVILILTDYGSFSDFYIELVTAVDSLRLFGPRVGVCIFTLKFYWELPARLS